MQVEYSAACATFTDNAVAGEYRAQAVAALYDRPENRHLHRRALRAASRPLLAELALNGDPADPNGQVSRGLLHRFERDEADAGDAAATDEQLTKTQAAVGRLSATVARAEANIDPQAAANMTAGQSWWLRCTGDATGGPFTMESLLSRGGGVFVRT